jgi:hypothetical protein
MALATLSVDLIAKLAKFEGDMGKAARATEKASRDISSAMNGIKSAIGVLGSAVSVAGLVNIAKAAIDSMDALNDLADATGASIENISALEDVAARTGTSMDTVSTALVKFNKVLGDAKPGSDAAAALDAIGLSATKLKTLDPAEALRQTAVALAGFADDGDKARIVQELFGKSIKEVAPLLKDLAEKGELVGTVTKEQALQAEKFNKQLFELQKNAQDAAREIAGPMVKALNELIDKFKEGRKAGAGFFDIVGNALRDDIRRLNGQAANTGGATGDWGPGAGGGRGSVFPEFVRPGIGGLPDKGKTTGRSSGSAKQSEADRYLETLQKQLEKTQELTTVQQLDIDIVAGRLGKLTNAKENELIQLALKIDGIKAQTEAEKQLAEILKQKREASTAEGDAVAESNKEYQALLSRLLGNTSAVKFEEQTKGLEVLRTELESGRIKADQYAEAVTNLFGLTANEASKTNDLAKELGLSFTSAFEDAIVGGQSFSDVLQGLEKDINRIVTRKMVTEPLGNAISGAVSGFNPGNFLSSLFSADGGGYTGAGSRTGGMDGKGGFMAMLHPQETVIDHTKGQRMGNTVAVTINQSFAQGTTRATTLQAAADASRQLQYAGRNL